jgi:hypothetical protein
MPTEHFGSAGGFKSSPKEDVYGVYCSLFFDPDGIIHYKVYT